jgi:DNA-binding PadR family transcriptional regulator
MHSDIEIKNLTKLFAILLLNEKDQHGYDIMKSIEARLGSKTSSGQIYPFLRQLKRYGYIDAKGAKGERDKQVYYLTPEGIKFVKRLSSKLEDFFEIAIKPNIITCAHCGCEIYKGGYKEKINGKYLSFCCSNCAKGYKLIPQIRVNQRSV